MAIIFLRFQYRHTTGMLHTSVERFSLAHYSRKYTQYLEQFYHSTPICTLQVHLFDWFLLLRRELMCHIVLNFASSTAIQD